jgi:hypothetical protein
MGYYSHAHLTLPLLVSAKSGNASLVLTNHSVTSSLRKAIDSGSERNSRHDAANFRSNIGFSIPLLEHRGFVDVAGARHFDFQQISSLVLESTLLNKYYPNLQNLPK